MAKVSYIDIVPEQQDIYWASVTPQDRFKYSRVCRKVGLLSSKRKKGVSARSLLPQISLLWANLSQGEKESWTTAAAQCGLNGWRLFVQDTTARIINNLAGVATPSIYHQSWVGQLHIEAPANELKIIQQHPSNYFIMRKVTGKKGQYNPVNVSEFLSLPLQVQINFKQELTSVGAGSFAYFYARVWSLYQGRDIFTDAYCDLSSGSGWQQSSYTLSSVIGQPISYDLFIHIFNMTGDLYCDNIKALHGATNWARDKYCNDINQGFTGAFYQIPKNWAGVTVPAGTWFESVYKDFS
jgi:hypothetical protein